MYFEKIRDDDEDMLAAILEAFDAAPKHNPELLKGGAEQQVLRARWPCLGGMHGGSNQTRPCS